MAELKREFKPEFLNRIDDIIVFHKLNGEDINKIIDLMLKKVVNRMKEQNSEELNPEAGEECWVGGDTGSPDGAEDSGGLGG